MYKLIKTKIEHESALTRLSELMEIDCELGSAESEEMELLAHLIEFYEASAYPIPLPDPVDAIIFHMEQSGMTRKELVPLLGSASKVSEVLNRKRPLSVSMMRRLNAKLGVSAEVLLQQTAQTQLSFS
jgi:HTH-type transcriptional regulator/antitoxin HigA